MGWPNISYANYLSGSEIEEISAYFLPFTF